MIRQQGSSRRAADNRRARPLSDAVFRKASRIACPDTATGSRPAPCDPCLCLQPCPAAGTEMTWPGLGSLSALPAPALLGPLRAARTQGHVLSVSRPPSSGSRCQLPGLAALSLGPGSATTTFTAQEAPPEVLVSGCFSAFQPPCDQRPVSRPGAEVSSAVCVVL